MKWFIKLIITTTIFVLLLLTDWYMLILILKWLTEFSFFSLFLKDLAVPNLSFKQHRCLSFALNLQVAYILFAEQQLLFCFVFFERQGLAETIERSVVASRSWTTSNTDHYTSTCVIFLTKAICLTLVLSVEFGAALLVLIQQLANLSIIKDPKW